MPVQAFIEVRIQGVRLYSSFLKLLLMGARADDTVTGFEGLYTVTFRLSG